MTDATRFWLDELDTPIGRVALVADDDGCLRALGFTDGHARMEKVLATDARFTRARNPGGLSAALRAYFEGDLSAIDGLPVAYEGTAFQLAVWRALREIPCGETRTYRDLATQIGNAAAVRAVGLANGANPIGIVVPCHRVIGSNGTLTGYGGGIARKRWLLEHEGAVARELALAAFGASTAAVREVASPASR